MLTLAVRPVGSAVPPDGTAVKGLNPRNTWVRVADEARGDERVDLYVEAAANPELHDGTVSYLGDVETAGDRPLYRLRRTELAVFDAQVWELAEPSGG